MNNRYKQSEQYLARALKTIPLGSQTFSKSKTHFPFGVSPYFIEKGLGSHVWDLDGNEYVDFVNGLLAISLGYQDPDVDEAVRKQLQQGVTFSLPHRLEAELAELIVDMVPCAEMVRYGKNGSDATSGAIRLARAYTGREHVAVCGYHGWQDWYIGSTARDLGVPSSTKLLTHKFNYNDIESLNQLFTQHPHQFAAVIMEPMNTTYPQSGFLESVKELTHKNGAVLIFDEMITGFRFANGGAQEYFGVIPDLATFGKGMANGYPLACVVGSKEIMQLNEEIFFSFTFGGETLSLAAAIAVLKKLQSAAVIKNIITKGERVLNGVNALIKKYNLEDIVSTCGHPSWTFLLFKDIAPYTQWDIKTLWMQEVLVRGILSFSTHNMSFAHTDEDIKKLLAVYDEVFPIIKDAVMNKKLKDYLRCEPLKPLFKVR
jgi:glutamate-1-semialdehyde 2,1-aminomutase